MKNIFFISILMLLGLSLQAQPINKSTTSSLLKAADLAFEAKDYYNAFEKYSEAYEELNDTETAYKRALSAYRLNDFSKAKKYFNTVLKKDKKKQEFTSQSRFPFGVALKMMEEYDDAIEQFQLFIAETEDVKMKELAQMHITGAEMAKEMVETLGLTVKSAGRNVNSGQSEYAPIYDTDGKTMYYASLNSNDVIELDVRSDEGFLKIYKSTKKDEKSDWSKGEELDQKINREDWHTGNPTLSSDGQRMYFTRAQLQGNYLGESKIYVSTRTDDGWSGATELVGINGSHISKQPAVGDLFGREVLYFVSDMDGGYGGFDVYYATRKGDGVYGDPVNLGPKINTPGDDETPFYRDGILYFSSDGHPGIGGFDIFNTVWDGTGWSPPANMGLGYNSPADDLYFMLDKEGYSGFLTSNREGTQKLDGFACCNDIYQVTLKKVEAGLTVGAVSGKTPLAASDFQLIEMTNDKPGTTKNKNSGKTHKTAFELELDKAYIVIANKEGYYPDTSKLINTVGLTDSKRFETILDLKPIPKPPEPEKPKEPEFETYTTNQPIELQNIFYDLNSAEILPDAEADLSIILDLMNKYPDMKIELSSHTDSQGKDKYNQDLSQRRASSAKKWLIQRGITPPRIRAVGKGEKEIRNQCTNGVKCTDEEHRYNRRTEFKITEGPTTIQIEKKRLRKKN